MKKIFFYRIKIIIRKHFDYTSVTLQKEKLTTDCKFVQYDLPEIRGITKFHPVSLNSAG